MALLDRLLVREAAPHADPVDPLPPFWRAQTRVLRADGQRWDLTKRGAGNQIAALRQTWQNDAWDYRDMIGELRYSHRLLARSVSSVRFFAAEKRPFPDEPAELAGKDHKLNPQLAADAVANLDRLPLDEEGPDGFVGSFTENISTAGELWVHGQPEGRSGELWMVRSISEITSAGDEIRLSELPNNALSGQRVITRDEELLRCWVRHPRWGQLADSPLRSMLDVLEEIVLTGREMRAAARSRIAANGVLLIPDELSLARTRQDVEEDPQRSVHDDDFLRDFTEDMLAPIRNEGDAGAVVPLVMRGPAESLKAVEHLSLQRDDAAKLMERLNGAVLRMLKGLDIQPEQVEGMSTLNHWSGWIVEAKDVKQQVAPTAELVAACLTKAFLRPALLALGHPPDEVAKVIVATDVSDLVENPNRGQDARDAHAALVISDETLRRELGYDEDDAPDEEEIQRRVAARAGIDPSTSAVVLELGKALREAQGNRQPVVVNGQSPPELPAGKDSARSAQPGERTPEKATPAEPTRIVAAAVDPLDGWSVDMATARELAAIDAALTERIITAADAAIARVIERAGGRARNAVRKDKALAASVEAVDTERVASVIGRATLLAHASLSDLLAESYARFKLRVSRWLADAAEHVASVVLRLLHLDRHSRRGREIWLRVVDRLEPQREQAVSELVAAMTDAADQALFREDPLAPLPGQHGEEFDTLISPAAVMSALRTAGGAEGDDPGGMGTGPVVSQALEDEGALLLGHEWQYRPELSRNTFLPHMMLDGQRFATWSDPKLRTDGKTGWLGTHLRPGDHKGCRCSSTKIYAIPTQREGLERLTEPLDPAQRALAEADTRAGRTGTSAQRLVEVRDRLARAVIGGEAA